MKPLYIGVAVVGIAVASYFGWRAQQSAGVPAPGSANQAGGSSFGSVGGQPPGAPNPGGQGAPNQAGAGGQGGAAPGARGPGGPAAVEVGKAVMLAVSEEVSATGSVKARESVMLRPEIAGRIVGLGFTDGSRVKKGSVLVSLDASLPSAELEQTKAELALAKSNFQRTNDLAQKNFVSERARDEAAANLKVVEARLQLAQARLARSQIRAPFDGVMGLKNVSVGDYIREGADVALLESVDQMKVDLRLPEKLLGRVTKGQEVVVRFDAIPNQEFRAKIEAIDTTVDPNGRSVIARGVVANKGGVLRSGMFARASVVLATRPQAIVVPEEAIVPIGADVFVFRVTDNKAQRVKIKLGQRKDGKVEVTEGLALNDVVVTAGQIKLRGEGGDIRIVEPRGPGGAGKGPDAKGPDAKGADSKAPESKGAPEAKAGAPEAKAPAPEAKAEGKPGAAPAESKGTKP